MGKLKTYAIPVLALLCLLPWVSAGGALLLGVAAALTVGNPHMEFTRKLTPRLLSYSVIGLGAGMNLITVAEAGIKGLGYTALSIILTLALGLLLGRVLRTEKDASMLITFGTAICGGSAIAALAPAIHAKNHNISVALGVVFLLNALALFIFPWVGHLLDLSQMQFGLWSALAIHDTSSVVGAGLKYGAESLEVGTTVKLARALWIVPLVFIIQALYHRGQSSGDADSKPAPKKYPWFILGFLCMAALVTYVPALAPYGEIVEQVARRALVITLFFIGTNLTRATVQAVGLKPLLQGVVLWILVASCSLAAIYTGLIS